jgi:hypothetical protein
VCHTSLSQLTTNFETNYDGNTPVTTYSRSEQRIFAERGDWFGWTFDTEFAYDGQHNLIIEVYWNGSDQQGQTCTYATGGTSRGLYDVNGTLSRVNYWHHMRITVACVAVEPTSLGRVRALYR